MAFLQLVLKAQAAMLALLGATLVIVPRWFLQDLLDQYPLDEQVWPRTAGVMALVMAMLMVLVAQRVAEVWWWAWSFVVLDVGLATLFVLKAAFRIHPSAGAWSWWVAGGVFALFGALTLLGVARASREKPIVP
jgi:hypothetical protein